MASIKNRINSTLAPLQNITCSPASLVAVTIFTALLFVLSEWIFIFTRPSFLKTVPFIEKMQALSTTSALLVLAGVLAVMLILIPWYLVRNSIARRVIAAVALLVPTLILTALLLLLVDNFTYTLFRFGIVSAEGAWRAVYAMLLILLAVYLYTRLAELGNLLSIFFKRVNPRVRHLLPVAVIVLAALGTILPANLSQWRNATLKQRTSSSRNTLPDILLITVDAVNAGDGITAMR